MFKKVNGKKVNLYRITKKPFTPLNVKNLWDKERSEYTEQNYPDAILSIIEVHKKASYAQIKSILSEYELATDLAFIIIAINELAANNKIKKLPNYNYELVK